MKHIATSINPNEAQTPVDKNDVVGALTAIEVNFPETFSHRAWRVIRHMEGAIFLFFYKGEYVITDESLYLTVHGDGTPEAPFGAPRWVAPDLEGIESWLESVADHYDEDGDVPGWETEERHELS